MNLHKNPKILSKYDNSKFFLKISLEHIVPLPCLAAVTETVSFKIPGFIIAS